MTSVAKLGRRGRESPWVPVPTSLVLVAVALPVLLGLRWTIPDDSLVSDSVLAAKEEVEDDSINCLFLRESDSMIFSEPVWLVSTELLPFSLLMLDVILAILDSFPASIFARRASGDASSADELLTRPAATILLESENADGCRGCPTSSEDLCRFPVLC